MRSKGDESFASAESDPRSWARRITYWSRSRRKPARRRRDDRAAPWQGHVGHDRHERRALVVLSWPERPGDAWNRSIRAARLSRAISTERIVGCVIHLAASTPEPGVVSHNMGAKLIVGEPGGATPHAPSASRRR